MDTYPETRTRSRLLVTGGTGTLGRQVVVKLRGAGADVRVLSRGRLADGADGADGPTALRT